MAEKDFSLPFLSEGKFTGRALEHIQNIADTKVDALEQDTQTALAGKVDTTAFQTFTESMQSGIPESEALAALASARAEIAQARTQLEAADGRLDEKITASEQSVAAVRDELGQERLARESVAIEDEALVKALVMQDYSRAEPTAEGSAYAMSFADSQGREAVGITAEAVLDMALPPTIQGYGGVTARPVDSAEWAFAVADSAGHVAFGVRADGSVFPAPASAPASPSAAGGLSKLASDMAGLTRSDRTRVFAVGDSLTYGFFDGKATGRDNWVEAFKALAPQLTVTNAAMSGFTVDEEAIRSGLHRPRFTVPSGAIPASGAVALNIIGADTYDWNQRSRALGNFSWDGALAGVSGRLTRDANQAFTFARTTAGETVPVAGEVAFTGSFGGHEAETAVIFIGRNNIYHQAHSSVSGSIPAHVVGRVREMVDALTPGIKQVLVCSVTTATNEVRGTRNYELVQEINQALAAEYPTRFFDLRKYLVEQAIHDLGISPTPADTTAMAGDALPPSIMATGADGQTRDGVHYSRDTARLVGQKIFEQLTQRGWINGA